MVGPGEPGIEEARLRAERELAHLVDEVGWDDGATVTG